MYLSFFRLLGGRSGGLLGRGSLLMVILGGRGGFGLLGGGGGGRTTARKKTRSLSRRTKVTSGISSMKKEKRPSEL